MESCGFIYQNIDLFSLYTSTFALLLVHIFFFTPWHRGPPNGPSLSWHQLASEAVVGSKGKGEIGQHESRESCAFTGSVGLCASRNIYLIGPFQNKTEFTSTSPGSGRVSFVIQAGRCPMIDEILGLVLPSIVCLFTPHDWVHCQSDMGKKIFYLNVQIGTGIVAVND